MKSKQTAMKDMGLRWNPKKCSVLHVKRGVQQEDNDSIKLDESFVIQSFKQQSHYKFLGVLENIKQEDRQRVPETALCDMVQPTIRCQQSQCIEPVCPPGVKVLDANTALADERPTTN